MDDRRQGKMQQAAAIMSALLIVWFSLPEQERWWMALRTVGLARQAADRLARLEGHQGMGAELKGRDPLPRYGGAVLAGRCRDRLDDILKGMKP